jgi:formylglycine-generating enzyme required for sulfatase activity
VSANHSEFERTDRELARYISRADACAGEIILGGSWAWAPGSLTVKHLGHSDPMKRSSDIGFRLARSLPDR